MTGSDKSTGLKLLVSKARAYPSGGPFVTPLHEQAFILVTNVRFIAMFIFQ
jgi:hypothetical protein